MLFLEDLDKQNDEAMKVQMLRTFFKNNKKYDLSEESQLGQGLLEGLNISA